MVYREIIAVCSQINTKHINILCGQNVELLYVKLVIHRVTNGLWKVQTPYRRVILEKLTVPWLIKKFPIVYSAHGFIAMFTKAYHFLWSRAIKKPVHVLPHHFFKIHFNITLSYTPPSPELSITFKFPYHNPVPSPCPTLKTDAEGIFYTVLRICWNLRHYILKDYNQPIFRLHAPECFITVFTKSLLGPYSVT